MLLILDEVMCGMGRTGTLHACEHEGIAPDLMAIAKGLGGGYQPVGAVLISAKVIDAIVAVRGFSSMAIRTSAIQWRARRRWRCSRFSRATNWSSAVHNRARGWACRFSEAFREHPHVGDVRGRGLFQAIELVADRASKQPFEPALKLHAKVKKAAMDAGLMCYPMGGTIDGARGDHVLLAPPFIIKDDELDLLIGRLTEAVNAAVQIDRALSPS